MCRHGFVFLWILLVSWSTTVSTSAESPDTEPAVLQSPDPPDGTLTSQPSQKPLDSETENVGPVRDTSWHTDESIESFDAFPVKTACTSCGDKISGDCQSSTCQHRSGLFVDGWIAQGFTGNLDHPRNDFNGPLTFNDRANEYQLNQMYLSLGRQVNTNVYGWGVGGRIDLLYGTDYFFTTARGLETRPDGSPSWNSDRGPRAGSAAMYGLAMPQLYAEAFAPIGGGVTIKAGHFYSLLRYESVMAVENFFYSHSYASQYAMPFTHTGVIAGYRVSPYLQVNGGFTRGWDNWEDNNNDLAFLGQVRWCSTDGQTSVRFALHTGNEDNLGVDTRTSYSLLVSRQVSSRWGHAIEHVFGTEENGAIRNNNSVDANWFGFTNYLTYQLTCQTQLGLRCEWFRDDENARVMAIPLDGSRGGDYRAFTLGLSHRPPRLPCWEIRSEWRYDWSNAAFPALNVQGLYDDFSSSDQFTFAISALARF